MSSGEEWWESPRDPRTPTFARLNELVGPRLPDGHWKRALDVASGKGTTVEMLVVKGYEVTAIELNDELAARLRQRWPASR
jgi:hypothetical protein